MKQTGAIWSNSTVITMALLGETFADQPYTVNDTFVKFDLHIRYLTAVEKCSPSGSQNISVIDCLFAE